MQDDYMEKDYSFASLDGTPTTLIATCEPDLKRYNIRSQGAVGDLNTTKFRTLKGARDFKHNCLSWRYNGLVSREMNRESKAKRTVYDYVLRYDYRDYVSQDVTPLTELNEFFPPS